MNETIDITIDLEENNNQDANNTTMTMVSSNNLALLTINKTMNITHLDIGLNNNTTFVGQIIYTQETSVKNRRGLRILDNIKHPITFYAR